MKKQTKAVSTIRKAVKEFLMVSTHLGQENSDTLALQDKYIAAITALAATVSTAYPETPWFDHRYDWLRGPDNWMWYERAIFGMQHIKKNDRVLDLCCGDGFFAGACFATRANIVHGLDRDTDAIATARRLYSHHNTKFYLGDIVQDDFPLPHYDVVTWFEGIEHLSKKDGNRVLKKIAIALSPTGLLIGSTPVEGGQSHPEHDNVFNSIAQLRLFLSPHFAKSILWTSRWNPRRVQGYFICEKPRDT